MNTLNAILYPSTKDIHVNKLKQYALAHDIDITKFPNTDSCDQLL